MTETTEKTIDKRLENLKPRWVKGESGNPNGRPKKEFSLTEGLREYISETDLEKKRERKDILIEKTYQMALRGDLGAIKEIWNRLEGLPQGSGTNIQLNILNMPVTEYTEEMRTKLIDKFRELEMSDPEIERYVYEKLKEKYESNS